jgi:hypothetical protein
MCQDLPGQELSSTSTRTASARTRPRRTSTLVLSARDHPDATSLQRTSATGAHRFGRAGAAGVRDLRHAVRSRRMYAQRSSAWLRGSATRRRQRRAPLAAPPLDRVGPARSSPRGTIRKNFLRARELKIQHGRSPAANIVTLNMRLKGEKQWDWDVVHCFGCWAYRCQL